MSRAFRLITVDQPLAGMFQDRPANAVPARGWRMLRNVRVTADGIEKVGGWTRLLTTGSAPSPVTVSGPVGLIGRARYSDGTELQLLASDKYLYRQILGGVFQPINGDAFTENLDAYWMANSIGELVYFNRSDGYVRLQELDQGAVLTTISTAPLARYLGQVYNHLMLGALVNLEGDSDLRGLLGSGNGDGRDWDYTNDNSDSIPISLPEGNDPVTSLAKFGSRLAIFKEASIHLLNFIGGDLVYTRDVPADDIGTIAPQSVVGYRSLLAFQGPNNFHLFNGTPAPQDFGLPVWNYYASLVRRGGMRTWSMFDAARDELLFVFQRQDAGDFGTGGYYTEALCYSLTTKAWTVREFPFSAVGFLNLGSASFTIGDIGWQIGEWTSPIGVQTGGELTLVSGDQDGNLYRLYEDNQLQADGNDIEALLETGETDFGDPSRVKFVSDLYLHWAHSSGTPATVQIGARDSLVEPVLWSEPLTADDNGRVTCLATGRYLTARIRKRDGTFKLTGYTWRVQPRGDY